MQFGMTRVMKKIKEVWSSGLYRIGKVLKNRGKKVENKYNSKSGYENSQRL
ncbi:hypothetical protein QFZ81_000174 [Paenibacillus sp. V4I9]|nr:hypothetical protein [Paenibacillus sp. V4I9]